MARIGAIASNVKTDYFRLVGNCITFLCEPDTILVQT